MRRKLTETKSDKGVESLAQCNKTQSFIPATNQSVWSSVWREGAKTYWSVHDGGTLEICGHFVLKIKSPCNWVRALVSSALSRSEIRKLIQMALDSTSWCVSFVYILLLRIQPSMYYSSIRKSSKTRFDSMPSQIISILARHSTGTTRY